MRCYIMNYADIQMMYLFNIPCIVAVGAMHHMMQNVYFEHYFAKDQLKVENISKEIIKAFHAAENNKYALYMLDKELNERSL